MAQNLLKRTYQIQSRKLNRVEIHWSILRLQGKLEKKIILLCQFMHASKLICLMHSSLNIMIIRHQLTKHCLLGTLKKIKPRFLKRLL